MMARELITSRQHMGKGRGACHFDSFHDIGE